MATSELAPLSVVPYHKSYIVDFVREKTGWIHRGEVADKRQLTYLCKYLEVDHIGAKTIVVEDEYVDRHYLEDYSEYYARCFPSHPRMCSRLHFFASAFTESEFLEALAANDVAFIESKLKGDSYIGFAVIRPIAHTFLAKLCLRPYPALLAGSGYRVIVKKNSVSLFGLALTVSSAPFVEQDKVVSACATSALWTLFSATQELTVGMVPSPSAITKAASHNYDEGMRTFPTLGLSELQVTRSLKHYGLEPSRLAFNGDGEFCDLRESVFGFVSHDIPILVGGTVYAITDEGVAKYLGAHLVCVLGFHEKKNTVVTDENRLQFRSHQIDRYYAHDDRYGPYLRIDADPIECELDDGVSIKGLPISVYEGRRELFIPDVVIIGLYHKIRITYSNIRDICRALHFYLLESSGDLNASLAGTELDDEERIYFGNAHQSVLAATSGVWEIALLTNSQVKAELVESQVFETFNGSSSKTSLLLHGLPKFLWRCRIRVFEDDSLYTDVLFDATEIPQGKVLIGFVSYSLNAERMWKYVENAIRNRDWDGYGSSTQQTKSDIGTFVDFFSDLKNRTELNTLYGPLGLPRRPPKPGETDVHKNFQLRKDSFKVVRGARTDVTKLLDATKKYIWVINELGDLIVGEDVEDPAGDFLGHPTLVDGKPARLGGELLFDPSLRSWTVNLKSRAYSAHIRPGSDIYQRYLESVISINFGSGVKAA